MYKYNDWQIDLSGFLLPKDSCSDDSSKSSIINSLFLEYNEISETDNGYLLPHSVVAYLDEDLRDSLGLPQIYPYILSVESNGSPDESLKFEVRYMRNLTQQIVNPRIVGCFIHISSVENYIFIKDQYALLQEIERSNSSSKTLQDNFNAIYNLKKFCKGSRVMLDEFCGSTNVIKPDGLSIKMKSEPDGSLTLIPQLCNNSEEGNAVFEKRFARLRKIKSVIPSTDGNYMLFSEAQHKALSKLKQNNRVEKNDVDNFIKSPESLLDTEIYNLDDFSDRVKEIGLYQPRVFPFIKPTKDSWLPEECGLIVDGTNVTVKQDDIPNLIEQIKESIEKQKPTVTFKGTEYCASESVLSGLRSLYDELNSRNSGGGHVNPVSPRRKPSNQKVLIIYDNIEDNDYIDSGENESGQTRFFLPKSLDASVTLLPHQKQGFSWLMSAWTRHLKGALLADDMGLGKTLQALTFLAALKEKMDKTGQQKKRFLIVAPVALLDNWSQEYKRFFSTSPFGQPIPIHSKNLQYYVNNGVLDLSILPDNALVLTTYETLRDRQLSFGKIDWAVIVLDEAQKIKTPTARMTIAAKAMKYDFGLCITGTPVENNWIDLWSIVDFSLPGVLGSLKDFNSKFQLPLSKPETNVILLGNDLKAHVDPFMLRRLKSDVCDNLPEKIEKKIRVDMSKEQVNAYIDIVNRAKKSLHTEDADAKQSILQVICYLRDVSLHKDGFLLSLDSFMKMPIDELLRGSARIRETIKILGDIKKRQEKAIIYLLSLKMQSVMQRVIKELLGVTAFGPINGKISGNRRYDIINQFQKADGFQVIILSPEAAGVGLNITEANHVIHLSRLWNPAKEDQATDRVYRIGQKHTVYVYYPMAVHPLLGENGSFDEKLDKLLSHKRILSEKVMIPTDAVSFEAELCNSIFNEEKDSVFDKTKSDLLTIDDVVKMSSEWFRKYIIVALKKSEYDVQEFLSSDIIAMPKGTPAGRKRELVCCEHIIGSEGALLDSAPIYKVLAHLQDANAKTGKNLSGVIATNAEDFTNDAKNFAADNGIELLVKRNVADIVQATPITIGELYDLSAACCSH